MLELMVIVFFILVYYDTYLHAHLNINKINKINFFVYSDVGHLSCFQFEVIIKTVMNIFLQVFH